MTERIKRPAFQFYPGDEESDTALMACSLLAYGLWKRMLNFMHGAEPYGHLVVAGMAMSDAQIAKRVGLSVAKVRALLAELEAAHVFSRTDERVIYSRRMVDDEHKRSVRAAGGRLGGNPTLLDPPAEPSTPADVRPEVRREDKPEDNRKVNHPPTFGLTPSSSSSSSSSERPATTTTAHVGASSDAEADATSAADLAEADHAVRCRLPDGFHADLDDLLRRVAKPHRQRGWLRSIGARLDGLHPPAVSPDAMGEALRQFNANDGASWKLFEGYVARVLNPPPPSNGASGPMGLTGPVRFPSAAERLEQRSRTNTRIALAAIAAERGNRSA